MTRTRKLVSTVVATALVTVGNIAMVTAPAAAKKVSNPGSTFTLKVQQGFLRSRDHSFSFNDEGRLPQCSDGRSNDDDAQDPGGVGAADYPADPQCGSAADDSEVQPGVQPKLPIQASNGTIDGAGNITFPTTGVQFPPQYVYVPDNDFTSAFILTITISPTQTFTGHVNPMTGAMDLFMHIKIVAAGGPVGSSCTIGPIDMNLGTGTTAPPAPNTPITGVPYNPATGRVTIVNNSFSIPGASNCGSFGFLNSTINSQLGLPSAGGNNEAQFTSEFIGTRPQPAITATFTTTPSRTLAPATVNFDATGSTGGINYKWDFTNDGTFDATTTGPTTSFLYKQGGSITARLRVTDADGDFAETTRTFSLTVNQAPVPASASVSTPEDTATAITLQATDADSPTPTFAVVSPGPAHGVLSGTAPSLTYTPAANYSGGDGFSFRVTDDAGNVATGTITITVEPVNDAPVAASQNITVRSGSTATVNLVATDADGDTLTYAIDTLPAHGTLGGSGAARTYTPTAGYTGPDSFVWSADDGHGGHTAANVAITVSLNAAPAVSNSNTSTRVDRSVVIALSATDADGDPITYGIDTAPTHGSLAGTGASRTYTPASGYTGPDSFVWYADDGHGGHSTATVSITVRPKSATSTSITADTPDPSSTSQAVTVRFSVTSTDLTATPTGTVTVTVDDASTQCAASVATGQCNLTFTALGSRTITATYGGDVNFLGSQSAGEAHSVANACTRTVTGTQSSMTASGGTWCFNNATIQGSLTVAQGTKVVITNSSMSNLYAQNGPAGVTVCGSTINGALTVSKSTGFVLIGDPYDDSCAANKIANYAQLNDNTAGVELSYNRIGGWVKVTGNRGGGPYPEDAAPNIEANTIGGSLTCSTNTPAAVNNGHSNTVSGARYGECTGTF